MKQRKELEIVVKLLGSFFLGALVCVGCGSTTVENGVSDKVEYPARTEYTDAEKRFIEEYQKVVSDETLPEQAECGVVTEENWQEQLPDFAIISLNQEDYGTDVFAFLPLEQRDLTEEELCSLAAAFQGEDAETILQDQYSYKSGSKSNRNVDSNRPLTVRENFMERISVLEQYLTKGKRAKGTEEIYPLCFTNSTGETVWIYPDRSMDEEQMLYLLDRRYGDMPEEAFTPKDGQLGEKAARKQAKKLLKEFVTKESATKIYVIYTNGSLGGRQTPDYWTAYMHLENEKNDFYLRISADSGELLEWKRLPNDFYTDEGYDANNMQNVVSDEQLLEVAKEYIQGYLHMEQVEYVIDASDEETAKVTAGTGRQVFKLTIDKNMLQVSGLEIEQ